MTVRHIMLSAAFATSLGVSAAAADPTPVPLDQEVTVGGVGVGCTGIGQTKDDPKWLAYPVKLEFADAQKALLANEIVTLSGAGTNLQVACEGPWLLLKLPVGQPFSVEARLAHSTAQPRTASIKAPAHGQATFVLTFPDTN